MDVGVIADGMLSGPEQFGELLYGVLHGDFLFRLFDISQFYRYDALTYENIKSS